MNDAEPPEAVASPGGRLRAARELAGVSRKQLATKLGKALSTIRAHENGQNAISADAASDYADQLGTSVTWLLFGEDSQAFAGMRRSAARPKGVPVKGLLMAGAFINDVSRPLPFDSLEVALPGYEHDELEAYVEADYGLGPTTEIVFVVPLRGQALRLIDEVVLNVTLGGSELIERSVWKVGAKEGFAAFYQGQTQESAHTLIYTREPDRKFDADIVGRVVGRLRLVTRADTVSL